MGKSLSHADSPSQIPDALPRMQGLIPRMGMNRRLNRTGTPPGMLFHSVQFQGLRQVRGERGEWWSPEAMSGTGPQAGPRTARREPVPGAFVPSDARAVCPA
jgi:hypothetical protein